MATWRRLMATFLLTITLCPTTSLLLAFSSTPVALSDHILAADAIVSGTIASVQETDGQKDSLTSPRFTLTVERVLLKRIAVGSVVQLPSLFQNPCGPRLPLAVGQRLILFLKWDKDQGGWTSASPDYWFRKINEAADVDAYGVRVVEFESLPREDLASPKDSRGLGEWVAHCYEDAHTRFEGVLEIEKWTRKGMRLLTRLKLRLLADMDKPGGQWVKSVLWSQLDLEDRLAVQVHLPQIARSSEKDAAWLMSTFAQASRRPDLSKIAADYDDAGSPMMKGKHLGRYLSTLHALSQLPEPPESKK